MDLLKVFMSKELEALKDVRLQLNVCVGLLEDIFVGAKEQVDTILNNCNKALKKISVIEKALQVKEELEVKVKDLTKALGIQALKEFNDVLNDTKKLKALNEILALHDKWLGNEISDFEFFTLLTEIRDKYDLLKEELCND